MTDKQILKSIKALARGECANYDRGNCLLTDERCHLVNPSYESIHDGAIDCDYFLECVLPADWSLMTWCPMRSGMTRRMRTPFLTA